MYSLEDYRVGNHFEDEDGNIISQEEAQAEVDWLNHEEARDD